MLETPALDLAPGGVKSVFRRCGVGVPFFLEQDLLAPAAALLGNLARRAAFQGPVARELLKRRAEGSKIEIDPGDAHGLELFDSRPHRLGNPRFHVFPIEILIGLPIPNTRAADQKDGGFGRRLGS